MVRTKQISAVEVLEDTLERVREVDGRTGQVDAREAHTEEDLNSVHAFTLVTEDYARIQAEKVDKMIKAGENPGPLAGVPYTAKDIFTVKGVQSRAASKILSNYISPYSATVVERMAEAGKPTKVALIAIARKLLTRLNAMLRTNSDYRKTAA